MNGWLWIPCLCHVVANLYRYMEFIDELALEQDQQNQSNGTGYILHCKEREGRWTPESSQ